MSPAARVFDPAPGTEAWLATARRADDPALEPFLSRGVRVLSLPRPDGTVDLAALLHELHALEVRSLLVEGGGVTAFSFLEAGLVDRVTAYVTPLLLGGSGAPSPLGGSGFARLAEAPRLEPFEMTRLEPDVRLTARVASS